MDGNLAESRFTVRRVSRDGSSIDHRLLVTLMQGPDSTLKTSMSLGLAIGAELAKRKQIPLLNRITVDKQLHDSAIAAALAQWADVAKDGELTERQFQKLCDRIVGIASAS